MLSTVAPAPLQSQQQQSIGTVTSSTTSSMNSSSSNAVVVGKGRNSSNKKMVGPASVSAANGGATHRQHSPGTEFDRAHSVDGSTIGPVPLRRASYAFDHAMRINNNHHHHRYQNQQKSSTPPYQHQQMNCAVMHQHSAPMANQHRDSRSDCGSSSGLGGMGTPVKEECGSCSASSNNSIVNCSHDSRDSGGPVSSSGGAGVPMVVESAATACNGNNNGHRSLVATATLTPPTTMMMLPSSCSPQQQLPQTTTISPVSSIPTLVQQHHHPQQQQHQLAVFSAPAHPASFVPQVHNPPHHHHQFGAFNNSPILPPPPSLTGQHASTAKHHQAQQQHSQQLHSHQQQQQFQSHQQQFNQQQQQQQLTQLNTLHAVAAAAAMCGISSNQQNGNGVTGNAAPPPPPPPLYKHQNQWNNNGAGTSLNGLNSIGTQQQQQQRLSAAMCPLPPPAIQQQQQQQQPFLLHQTHPLPMGRALYTMTCETAALASVGTAAVTAGYHVTLDPCASAPPIILPVQQPTTPELANPETIERGIDESADDVNGNNEQQQQRKHTDPELQNGAVPEKEGRGGVGNVQNNEDAVDTANANSNEEAQQQQEQRGNNENGNNLQTINGPTINGDGNDSGEQQQLAQNGTGSNTANRHMPPGVPPEIAAAINGGHDLFVHIHPGDAIALAVGNEIQHIYGPATIRMVSQSAPPSAIPMNVPQGHVVQQLLDRQGYLSHIIMSPQEMPPPSNAVSTTPMGMGGNAALAQQQIMMTQQQPQMAMNSQRMQNALLPLQHHQMPVHSSPSPQKNATGRYRPSPSSSASPPNMLPLSQQQQQFVLPPGYEQIQQQQQFGPTESSAGGGPPQYGNYGGGGNPLNKWSPRSVHHNHHQQQQQQQQQQHYHQQQQYGGGGNGAGGSGRRGPVQLMQQQPQQLSSALNQNVGPFYMDTSSATQLYSIAGGGASPSIAASVYGQPAGATHQQQAQQILYEAPAYSQQQQQQQGAVYPTALAYGIGGNGGQTGMLSGVIAGQMSMEDEEKERLREALSSLQPPVVTRVGEHDADVVWQELDTSEAAASLPGFPEINQSEFVYQLMLYKQEVLTDCYKMDANSGNVMHLQRLRPATDYRICIRADLPGHGITGHSSAFTTFQTHPPRPDAPSMPKVLSRHQNAITLQWRTPPHRIAAPITYCLQMAKGKSAVFESVYEGGENQTTVNGLEHLGCTLRFRVFARNDTGQSDFSPQLTVYPDRNAHSGGEQQQQQPHYQHHAHHPNSHHHHHSNQAMPPQQQQPLHLLTKGQSSPSSSSTIVVHPTSTTTTTARTSAAAVAIHPPTVNSVTTRAVRLSWDEMPREHQGNDYPNVTLEMLDMSVRNNNAQQFVQVPTDCYTSSGTSAHVTGLQSNREYRFRLAVNTHNGETTLHSEFVTIRTRGHNEHQQQQQQQQHDEQQQQQQRASPAVKLSSAGGAHQQQQSQKRSGGTQQQQQQPHVPQLQKKQQQQQQTKFAATAPVQQQQKQQPTTFTEDAPPESSAPSMTTTTASSTVVVSKKEQQPQQKAPNCSAPKFVTLTCECAKVDWRLLVPRKGNSVDSQASSSNGSPAASSAASNSALMFELQRVDRAQPQIVYAGSDPEFELNGLRPVEHLQLRVRAVLLDTEGRRFEGDWSQVGSACTPCAPPSPPRNVRLVEPNSPTATATPATYTTTKAEGGTVSNAATEEELDKNTSDAAATAHRQKKQNMQKQQQHGGSTAGNIGICWDQPAQSNGAVIREYSIYTQRYALEEENAVAEKKPVEERVLGTCTDCHFQMPRLQPAQRYVFTVSAHNEAGESTKSEPFIYNSPPGVPDPPRDFHAEALSTTELQLSWIEPISCNGAPVISYHVNCYRLYNTRNNGMESAGTNGGAGGISSSSGRHRQLVSQQIVPSSQRLLLVQSLETDSDYELVLQAENAIGKSSREMCRCATFQEPPPPPELILAQATANTLKLKWNPIGDTAASTNHYFYLERENENGTFSPVYEGDLRTAKVKGLRERSTHTFRIRTAIAKGMMLGAWSKRFSFQTTRQPPPAPKQAPIATELTPELFQLEWNAVRPSSKEQQQQPQQLLSFAEMKQQQQQNGMLADQQQHFIYRLQVAPKLASSAKEKSAMEVWKVAYEGNSTQCTVSVPNIGNSQQTRQARLFLVQQFLDQDGQLLDECVSAPSPLVVFGAQKTPNESPRRRPLQAGSKNASGPSTSGGLRGRQQQAAVHYPNPKEPKMTMYKRLKRFGSWMKKTVSEKDCALIVLAIFVLLAFGIAVLLNNYYLN